MSVELEGADHVKCYCSQKTSQEGERFTVQHPSVGGSKEGHSTMPAVPVAITKEHVNAVSRAMAGQTSYADGDVLLSAFASPESQQARKAYVERRLERKDKV
jgi:putative IMPACT (imprinted ancient) family translation regulator